MKKNISFFFKIACCLYCFPLFGHMEPLHEFPAPERIKNFALPTSQELSPLVAFGQTIRGEGVSQLYVFADAFIGTNTYVTSIEPYFVYGLRDDLSLSAYFPVAPKNKEDSSHSSGMQDIFAQLEYAVYAGEGAYYEDQATLVAQILFPTGSSTKDPPTGTSATSFLLGATLDRMTYNWYFFVTPGVILTTYNHGTKFGNHILYQCGIGRNIPSPSGWIFAALLEFDGQYTWKNRVKGSIDFDSGGNVIYLTPSMWFSSKRLILQFGAGYPIVQNLFGSQPKQYVSFNFNFGITL